MHNIFVIYMEKILYARMYLLQTCNEIVFDNKPLNANTGIN